jgi:predicted protein tyrosine phosphatase
MATKLKNYLFICYANIHRSKTAEDICRILAELNSLPITISSAAVCKESPRTVSKEMADRADVIFVMEEYMKVELEEDYEQDPSKIICLNIPDVYERGHPELVRILTNALSGFVEKQFCRLSSHKPDSA